MLQKDFEAMSVEELKELLDSINDQIAFLKAEAKAEAEAEAEERDERFRNELKEGDVVNFLFGSVNELAIGEVKRVSEKSVTIVSEVFAKGIGRVKFGRVLEVLEEAV